MSRTWWVKRLFGRRAAVRPRPLLARPRVVPLEDRTVPAYTWGTTAGGVLTIVADPGDTNALTISFNAADNEYTFAEANSHKFKVGTDAGNALVSGNNSVTLVLDGTKIGSIAVDLGNKSDTVTVQSLGGDSLTLTGGGDGDTLVGPNTSTTWTVTGADAGTLAWGAQTVTFTGVGNLTGGSAADVFEFAPAGSVVGTLAGGGGTDRLDYSAWSSGVTVDLAAGTADSTGGIASIEDVRGGTGDDVLTGGTGPNVFFASGGEDAVAGGGGADKLVGVNAAGDWTVTGANAGTVTWAANETTFSAVPSLTGGTAADDFALAGGTISGAIDGGGGADSLTADNVANTWTVSGPNAGTVTGVGSFADIDALVGGTAADTFNVNSYGTAPLAIDGGLPAAAPGDTLALDAQNKTVALAAGSLTVGALVPVTFAGIETLALINATDTVVNGTGGDDTLTLAKVGGVLTFSLNGGPTLPVFGNKFTFNGLAGSDGLTIDYTGGALGLSAGVVYGGGAGVGSDSLTLQGGTTVGVTHQFLNANDGSVILTGALAGTVTYTGLEPVTDTLIAGSRTFDYLGAAETITVTDTGGADGQSTIASTLGESVTFANPTASLTILTTNGTGADAVNVTSVDAAFRAALTVTAAAGDTLTLSAGLTLGSATSTGAVSLTAGTIQLAANVATNAGPTNAGPVAFAGAVVLLSDVVIDAGAAGTPGAVTFGGTVNGPQNLGVTTGGLTTLSGAVGGTTALASLTTDAAGTTAVNGGTVKTAGAQTFNDAVTLGAGTTFTSTAAGVTFGSTLNGANTVSVTTATGATFSGAVGGSTALTSLTVTGTAAVNGGAVKTTGLQNYGAAVTAAANAAFTSTGNGAITFPGTLTAAGKEVAVSTGGATTFGGTVNVGKLTTNAGGTTAINTATVTATGDVSFGDPVTLGTDVAFTGANVAFGSTLDGGFGVVVTSAGTTTFGGAVGGTAAPTSLTTDAGGTTAVNGGLVKTTGPQTFGDAVALGATATFTSTGGAAIGFASTLDGPGGAAVNTTGPATFGGSVGGSSALASLTTDVGGTTAVNGATVKTTGLQAFNDPVTVGANVSFTSSGSGAITFADTLTAAGKGVAVNTSGATTFGGTVTVGTLTTNAGGTTAVNTPTVTATGDLSFGDPVTIGTNVTFTGANVAFAAVDGAFAVVVNSPATTAFGGPVGATAALTSLTTDVGGNTAVNGGAVKTTGTQTFNDAVTLGSAATFTSTGGAAIDFAATLDGPGGAVVNTTGATTFAGTVGGSSALLSLATDAGGTTVIDGGLVKTTGGQSYGDPVSVALDTAFTSTSPGAVTFAASLSAAGKEVAVNTGGVTTFGGPVVAAKLTTDGAGTTAVNTATVSTTGDTTFGDAVTVGAGVTFTAANVTFAKTLDGGFVVAVDTAGATTFGGAVGGTAALASLTTDAAGTTAVNGGLVRTTGPQTFNNPVSVGANAAFTSTGGGAIRFADTLLGAAVAVNTSGATTFDGAVSVAGLTTNAGGTTAVNTPTVIATGDLSFGDPVTVSTGVTFAGANVGFAALDGGFPVIVTSPGATTFGGLVGGTAPLTSLITDAGGTTAVNGGGVTTTAGETYGDPVTLGGAATFASTGAAAIAFGSTLDGPGGVVVNTTGATTFGGAVGVAVALGSLTTDVVGTTAINGGAVRTTGGQSYGDSVTVGADTYFTSTANGAIAFAKTLTATGRDVAVNSGGATTFNGAVAVGSLTTNAGGTTAVNTPTVTATGNLAFGDAVTVGVSATFAGVNVTFAAALDGGFDVAVTSPGATTFGGPVGSSAALASLTTDAGGTTAVNGGGVRTTGAQSYGDPVSLGAAATFASTGGAAIAFGSTLDGPGGATVNTAGATTFAGAVGGTAALASLSIGAGGTTALNGGLVKTTGAQSYGDPITAGADTTFTSTGAGAIAFGGALTAAGKTIAVNTTGATTFGGLVAVAKLTTDAGGTTAVNTSTVTATGNLAFGEPVTLGTNATFTAANATFAKTLDGGFAVAVNSAGATTFGGAVGGSVALASLSTNAGGTTGVNGGLVKTTGAQSYGDPVTLGTGTTFAATAGGAVTFAATLSGGGATVNTAGTTTFGGAVTTAALTTDASGSTVVNTGTVTTTGPQSFGDPVSVNQPTTFAGSAVAFASTLSAVGHGVAVNSPGTTVFGGAVSAGSLTTDTPGTTAVNGGAVTTAGAQTFGDPVFVGKDTTFASIGGGAVTFVATLDGTGTAVAVNTSGVTTFGGPVSPGRTLLSLSTDAGGSTQVNGGVVLVVAGLSLADPVGVGADTTFTADAQTFGSSLTGPGKAVLFTGNSATFNGALAIGSVNTTLSAIAVNGGSVTTSGPQYWSQHVTVGADTAFTSTGGDAITFVGPFTAEGKSVVVNTAGTTSFAWGPVTVGNLTTDAPGQTVFSPTITVIAAGTVTLGDAVFVGFGDLTVTAGVDAVFGSSLGGAWAVVVNAAGVTTFGGPVAVARLTTDVAGTTTVAGGAVSATLGLTFNDPVVTTLNTGFVSGGDVIFAQSLSNAGLAVAVNSPGTVTFGSVVDVGSLGTDAPGTTRFTSATLIRTTGFQVYGDPVTADVDVAFVSTGGGDVRFAGPLTAGTHAIVVNTAGETVFDGPVAAGVLGTDAGGRTRVNGGSVSGGLIDLHDAVFVGANTTFAGGTVLLHDTLDAAAPFAIVVNSAGATRFGGAVGAAGRLGSLTTDAAGATEIGGPLVSAVDDLTFNDPVNTGQDVVFTADRITFGSTLTGASKVTLDGRAATVTGAVSAGAFATTLPDGLMLLNASVETTGEQTYGNAVTGPNGLALGGSKLAFAGDVTSPADVALTARGGGLAQTGGRLSAPTLGLFGGGDFSLEQPGNDVAGALRADLAGGSVRLTDANDLTIDVNAGGVAVGNGDVVLRTGGHFTAVDPRADAAKYSTAFVRLGSGTFTVQPGLAAGATVQFDVEIAASQAFLGTIAGGNDRADLFKVRPSATTPITVYGHGPTTPLPANTIGDRLFPYLTGLTVTNFQSTGVDGSYEFAGRAKLTYFGFESLQRFALSGYVLQTGEPRDGSNARGFDYAVRVVRTQDGIPLGGGLSGSSLPANPFVVSPSLVNPYSPSSAPRIEFADVNGDGTADLILAAGPGSPPLVTVIDGVELNANPDGSLTQLQDLPAGAILAQFYAYDPRFQGGINLAAGDLDGDGRAEIVTGAEIGGGPHVRRFTLVEAAPGSVTRMDPLQAGGPLASFFAFEPSFTGGVRVAVADVTGDGRDDLVIGAGVSGGPRVTVLDGKTGGEVANFFAYDASFRGGIYVDAGDYDGDGFADVLTGPGAGGGAHVRVFGGRTALGGVQPSELAGFLAFQQLAVADPLFGVVSGLNGVGGVSFGAGSPAAASRDILVTTPRGAATRVYVYAGNAHTPDASTVADLTGAIYSDRVQAALNRLPYIPSSNPPAGALTYGGTTGGFLDQSE